MSKPAESVRIQARWLSAEPAGAAAANPSKAQTQGSPAGNSASRVPAQANVANRPLTATDPTGLMCAPGECSSMNGTSLASLIESWEGGEVALLDGGGDRQIDGLDASCYIAEDMISDGFGVQCPTNYCGNGTRTPFTCLGNNCGYWTMQYTATHEYDCAGGLRCTETEWNSYQKSLESGQASDVAKWLNAWAAANCPTCAQVTAQDLQTYPLHAQGGNENFDLGTTLALLGWQSIPSLGRYGSLDGSMHIEQWTNQNDRAFIEGHWDAANPWADFTIGLAIRFTINVVLGTLSGMGGALY